MRAIGVDVGGTFTDLIYCDTETADLAIHKVSTTPDDPSRAVIEAIVSFCSGRGIDPATIEYVFHGTTTATNAVLEGRGALAGMITNEGFRDVLHIGRHQRVEHYSIMQELPWQNRPLVQRQHRKVVGGRLIPPHGEELVSLDEEAVRRAAIELRDEGVTAVAICFLFSYLNSSHEDRAAQIVSEVMPDAFVTTSSYVSPQFREFERFTTACIAASVGPKVRSYIQRLATSLNKAGFTAELRIMASNGGVATASMVAAKPALTLLSGLAAGVLGGAWVGDLVKRRRLVTFDIGGTSADIGIVVDGRVAETDSRSTSIAGFPLLMPMIDVHTIGAGGGSIAHIDKGGAFRVGPQSAGAVPGPAAYGRGGELPTVTDANIVLGRLSEHDLLGGGMKLDVEAARRVVGEFAQRLGMSLEQTAEGILTLINSNMANAIRSRTVQKGIDPRDFALVAFGGAGPLHAADVAAMLGIPEVIVPPFPGITSAMGLLTTDLKYDSIRIEFQTSGREDIEKLNHDFDEMEQSLAIQFAEDRVPTDSISYVRTGDLRYVGQGYELRIPFPEGDISAQALAEVYAKFNRTHAAEYGRSLDGSAIEIVNIRVSGVGRIPKLSHLTAPVGGSLEKAKVRVSQCTFRVDGTLQQLETAIYQRSPLPVGAFFHGPAIIQQADSTTVVPPNAEAKVDPTGSIILTLGGNA